MVILLLREFIDNSNTKLVIENNVLYVENYKEILVFKNNIIKLMCDKKISIEGSNLIISKLNQYELSISGNIRGISFGE